MKRKSILLGILLFGNSAVFASMNKTEALKLLGLAGDPDETAIKKAYQKLALKFHPDKGVGNEEKFKNIQEAYDFLTGKSNSGSNPDEEKIQLSKVVVNDSKEEIVDKIYYYLNKGYAPDKIIEQFENDKGNKYQVFFKRSDFDADTLRNEMRALLDAEIAQDAGNPAVRKARSEEKIRKQREKEQLDQQQRAEQQRNDFIKKFFENNKTDMALGIIRSSDYSLLSEITTDPIPDAILKKIKNLFFFSNQDITNDQLKESVKSIIENINLVRNYLFNINIMQTIGEAIKKSLADLGSDIVKLQQIELLEDIASQDNSNIATFVGKLFTATKTLWSFDNGIKGYKSGYVQSMFGGKIGEAIDVYREKYNNEILIPAFKKSVQNLLPEKQALLERITKDPKFEGQAERLREERKKIERAEVDDRSDFIFDEADIFAGLKLEEKEARTQAAEKERLRRQEFLREKQRLEFEEDQFRKTLEQDEFFDERELKNKEKTARAEGLKRQNDRLIREQAERQEAERQEEIRWQREQEEAERLRRANDPKNRQMLMQALELAMSLKR